MAFWGVEVKPGKPFTHKFDDMKGRLHVSMATLGFGTATAKSILQCNVGNKSPVYLCSLYPGNSESLQLNLEFEEVDEVIFSVIGPRSVHLSGYYPGRCRNTNVNEESESYGEDIGDTETERSDFGDEDKYEDSFIDDGDQEVLPSSLMSDEDEASHDSRPKGRLGSRRRLRRKYRSIESDDDLCFEAKTHINSNTHDQTNEIDDEDCLPISSLYNSKASGRILDQNRNESDDSATDDASKESGDNGGNSIVKSNLQDDTFLVDTQTNRGTEPLDNLAEPCIVLNVGNVQKLKKKEKDREGKDYEAKDACNGKSIKMDTGMHDELPMDKIVQDLPTRNEQGQEQADDNREAETSDNVLPSKIGHQQGEKPKKKRKEQSKEDMTLVAKNSQKHMSNVKEAETTDKVPPSSKVGHELAAKPKKKTKERSNEGITLVANGSYNSNLIDQDKAHQDEIKAEGMFIDQPWSNENSQKPMVHEDVELQDNVASPYAEMGPEKGRTKRKKKDRVNRDRDFEVENANHKDVTKEYKHQGDEKVDYGNHDFPSESVPENKKVKRRKKTRKSQGNVEVVVSDAAQLSVNQNIGVLKDDRTKMTDAKPSLVRTLSNGLVIQELESGKEDGTVAASGRKISVHYIGRLKENEKIFESNVGRAPYKFRLGKGKVIEGWDVGVEGMRVGEKRRLVVPPSMGFGTEGHGESIPPNSWLVYDLELVKVQ